MIDWEIPQHSLLIGALLCENACKLSIPTTFPYSQKTLQRFFNLLLDERLIREPRKKNLSINQSIYKIHRKSASASTTEDWY